MKRNDHVRLSTDPLVHWVTGVGNAENFLVACDRDLVYEPRAEVTGDRLTCLRCLQRRFR